MQVANYHEGLTKVHKAKVYPRARTWSNSTSWYRSGFGMLRQIYGGACKLWGELNKWEVGVKVKESEVDMVRTNKRGFPSEEVS